MSNRTLQMQIPILITAIAGMLMIFEHFFPLPGVVTGLNITLRSFVAIISAAALILGTVVLSIYHVGRVEKKTDDWGFSVVYAVSFVATALLGLMSVHNELFLWIYNNMTAPIGAALYSLTAFYITSAAFRVFRARNWGAAVLLVTSFIVLLMLIPIGAILLPPVVPIGSWLRAWPSAAGYRGMIIGTSLGVIGLGVRVFLGRQKEHLGVREESVPE